MNEQPTPMIPDYKIVQTRSLGVMEKQVDELMKDGWQIVGDVKPYMAGTTQMFYRELVKLRPDEEAIARAQQALVTEQERFARAIENMDGRVRDLLDINNIELVFVDGLFYTNVNGKTEEGINAYHILDLLKKSKHYPVDMDDATVINAIEGLV